MKVAPFLRLHSKTLKTYVKIMKTQHTSREPFPDRFLNDIGAFFALGAAGGCPFYFIRGIYTAPKGEHIFGGAQDVRMNVSRIGGRFAIWGGVFSIFDCSMAYLRQKEDPWNTIFAGGLRKMRQGLRVASRSALLGAAAVALIEGDIYYFE